MLCKYASGELALPKAEKNIPERRLKERIQLSQRFKNIQLHEYIIMPTHFHAILETVGAPLVVAQNANVVQNANVAQMPMWPKLPMSPKMPMWSKYWRQKRATTRVAPTKTLGDMVGIFESITTVKYIRGVKNFVDHFLHTLILNIHFDSYRGQTHDIIA
mgnify:FL=1